ncbi:MAG: rhodanese-like domain-containing protein [Burkholderiaceae bacterium]
MRLLELLTLATLSLSQTVGAQPIVDTDFVKKAVARGTLIWDTRDPASFAKGHLPRAINLGNPNDELRDAHNEDYLPPPRLEKILGAAGIDPAREIVVYGQRGATSAYFALLTLQHFGATRASVYHDGIDAWRAANLPLDTAVTAQAAIDLKLKPVTGVTIDTRQMLAALERPGVQLIDVRTPKEFSGEDIRALRGGHIPGARSIPYEQNWNDPDSIAKMRRGELKDTLGMSLKPAAELQQLYTGLDPARETLVYCNSGVRAAETAVVLKQLGFKDVKVYDPSWIGWANTLKTPVESETFFNVGALNARLGSLQSRIDTLERQLAETQKRSVQ